MSIIAPAVGPSHGMGVWRRQLQNMTLLHHKNTYVCSCSC